MGGDGSGVLGQTSITKKASVAFGLAASEKIFYMVSPSETEAEHLGSGNEVSDRLKQAVGASILNSTGSNSTINSDSITGQTLPEIGETVALDLHSIQMKKV